MPTLSPQLIRERLKKYHVTEDQLRKIAETKLRQKSRILEQQKDERFRNWVRPARWPVPDSDDPSTNSKYPSRGKRKSTIPRKRPRYTEDSSDEMDEDQDMLDQYDDDDDIGNDDKGEDDEGHEDEDVEDSEGDADEEVSNKEESQDPWIVKDGSDDDDDDNYVEMDWDPNTVEISSVSDEDEDAQVPWDDDEDMDLDMNQVVED
ncbi:uncharacterized protein F4817DRAFT_315385 [Daldinia loculata]|uniref:uncharacterized protein n=1 Tax=Daldinia loculata TaxID=103429 RepID=UPI0020C3B86F|nr:uncharacterized protein F4817DRAFT_315385 [Daldinia loculata]KAI1647845.1 hypothetical protein F4817DRAFT_315385 [Daldinia loculata]